MILATADSAHWYSDPHTVAASLRVLTFPLVFLAALVGAWWHKHREKIALRWPSVEDCVQFVSIAPCGRSSAFSATLEYSYFVSGYRSGSYSEAFDSMDDANDFIQMMKDQKVPVRYNPKNPDESLIEEADVEQLVPLPPR